MYAKINGSGNPLETRWVVSSFQALEDVIFSLNLESACLVP